MIGVEVPDPYGPYGAKGVGEIGQPLAGLVVVVQVETPLPATGFAAYEFENDFVDGGSVKAYYGGLFMHRGNVRRVDSRGD